MRRGFGVGIPTAKAPRLPLHERTQLPLTSERHTRSAQPEEGVEITVPEEDGEAVVDGTVEGRVIFYEAARSPSLQ